MGGRDGITAADFAKVFAKIGDTEDAVIRLHSYGGDVYDGQAIYNTIKRHKGNVRVEIDGAAMSAASYIAMAGDEIAMAENAIFMIHDPWTVVMGNAADMREMAGILDTIRDTITGVYAKRTGMSADELNPLLAAETYYNAQAAFDAGFATEVIPNKGIDNLGSESIRNRWKQCPDDLINKLAAVEVSAPDARFQNMQRRVAVHSQFRS